MLGDVLGGLRLAALVTTLGLRNSRAQQVTAGCGILLLDILHFTTYASEINEGNVLAKMGPLMHIALNSLALIDLLLLTPNPQQSIQPIGQDYQTSSLPLLDRLKWAFNVVLSPRRIGTTAQVAKIPPFKGPSEPGAFARSQLWRLAPHACSLGLLFLLSKYTVWEQAIMFNEPRTNSVAFLAVRRLCATALYIYASYVNLHAAYLLLSVFTTWMRWTRPEEWPDLFGHLSRATTIANCWGECWHQLWRQPFKSIPTFLVNDILGIPRRTLASSYAKLFIAFGLSAWGHAAGDYVIFRGARWFAPRFFMLQPCAIVIESAAIALIGRIAGYDVGERHPRLARCIGYTWVAFVLSMTVPEAGLGTWIVAKHKNIDARY